METSQMSSFTLSQRVLHQTIPSLVFQGNSPKFPDPLWLQCLESRFGCHQRAIGRIDLDLVDPPSMELFQLQQRQVTVPCSSPEQFPDGVRIGLKGLLVWVVRP